MNETESISQSPEHRPRTPIIRAGKVPNPDSCIKITLVEYFTKFSLESGVQAGLYWLKDNTISLIIAEDGTELFHCAVQDIKSLKYTNEYTKIKLRDGRKFAINFNLDAYLHRRIASNNIAWIPGGQDAPENFIPYVAGAIQEEREGDSMWWADSLKKSGAKVWYISVVKFNLLVVAGIVIGLLLIAFVIAVFNSVSGS